MPPVSSRGRLGCLLRALGLGNNQLEHLLQRDALVEHRNERIRVEASCFSRMHQPLDHCISRFVMRFVQTYEEGFQRSRGRMLAGTGNLIRC